MKPEKLINKTHIHSSYGTLVISDREVFDHTHKDPHPLISFLKLKLEMIRGWRKQDEGRNELMKLNDHLLRDIGITRGEAEQEANKWFWQS